MPHDIIGNLRIVIWFTLTVLDLSDAFDTVEHVCSVLTCVYVLCNITKMSCVLPNIFLPDIFTVECVCCDNYEINNSGYFFLCINRYR